MTQKQDRINDALKERITQLEKDLSVANERLLHSLDQNEELQRGVELIHAEAHDVVGKWEQEAATLRQKLEAAEARLEASTALVKEKDATVRELEDKLKTAEAKVVETTASTQELRKAAEEASLEKQTLLERATRAEQEWIAASQTIREFEALTKQMQEEMKNSFANEQEKGVEIERLLALVSKLQEENKQLREECGELSSEAERLLLRYRNLKRENELLSRDVEELKQKYAASESELTAAAKTAEVADQRYKLLRDDLERAQSELVRATSTNKQQSEETAHLTEKLLAAQTAEQNAHAASQQQLEVITALEKDVQEAKDGEVMLKKVIEELQRTVEESRAALNVLTVKTEETETEFATVKECYANVLEEAAAFKATSESALTAANGELASLKAEFTSRYDAAVTTINELVESLFSNQVREMCCQEQLSRQEIVMAHSQELCTALNAQWQTANTQWRCASVQGNEIAQDLSRAQAEVTNLLSQRTALESRLKETEHELQEQRKASAKLEGKLGETSAALSSAQSLNSTLTQDNAWLKQQVDAMRQELGELDEILNVNLNEMREENEKHELEISALRSQLLACETREATYEARIEELVEQANTLQREFVAQGRTLGIAESELKQTKQQIEEYDVALKEAKQNLTESEDRAQELQRSNSAMTGQLLTLREQVQQHEVKLSMAIAGKRHEIDSLRSKVNEYIEKYETKELLLVEETRKREEAENTAASNRDNGQKLRAALEELKERCAKDADTIRQLLQEREDYLKERDLIVEKYNKLHDAFRAHRKEATGRAAEEIRRLVDLCSRQETELQSLRQQLSVLKKSVSMFVTTSQPRAEAVFMERLNLTEGPLRHPKKRSATASD